MSTHIEERFRSGRELYGDDFSAEAISHWYSQEEHGYFGLTQIGDQELSYGYAALNKYYAFDALTNKTFNVCLALGCADGSDVAPLAAVVQKFVAVEPARDWWRTEIGGKPATYVSPSPQGDLSLSDGSVDLAISLGVLHHIPNVTHVIQELSRTLKPGGLFILREPTHAMGDWRKPRAGLTKNERGIPRQWLKDTLKREGFELVAYRDCMFPALARVCQRLGLPSPYSNKFLVRADAILSAMFSWNDHYFRDSFFKKFAPSSIYAVARKT